MRCPWVETYTVNRLRFVLHLDLLVAHNVLLVGYRGTGKSTVGRVLAQSLDYQFIDTDDEIESRARCSITSIFSQQGEEAFRDLESRVIAEFASKQKLVLSLGGGAILRKQNRDLIAQCGPVVWLTATVATIANRVGLDPDSQSRRPNLTVQGGVDEIELILSARLPIYQAVATFIVATDDRTPEKVVDEILRVSKGRLT